jgi:hypothetical protein
MPEDIGESCSDCVSAEAPRIWLSWDVLHCGHDHTRKFRSYCQAFKVNSWQVIYTRLKFKSSVNVDMSKVLGGGIKRSRILRRRIWLGGWRGRLREVNNDLSAYYARGFEPMVGEEAVESYWDKHVLRSGVWSLLKDRGHELEGRTAAWYAQGFGAL